MSEIAILALLFAICTVAGAVLQSFITFRAIAQTRSDYLDILLTQAQGHREALDYARATQSVGGQPLELAIAMHESQRDMALADSKNNYELAKLDLEARRNAARPSKPVVVPPAAAMGS